MENRLTIFSSLRSNVPLNNEVEMNRVVDYIRTNTSLKEVTEAYRNCNDDARRKELKCSVYAVMAACRIGAKRQKKDVTGLTGLSLCDFDGVPSERIAELCGKIDADPHTLLRYVTLSGKGIRVFFRYELNTGMKLDSQIRFYDNAYRLGNEYYAAMLGCPYDDKCKDIVRLSSTAYDPTAYYNPEAVAFSNAEIKTSVNVTKKTRKAVRDIGKVFKRLVEPKLKEEEIEFAAHSHNAYIMRTGYMMNSLGMDEEDVVAWAVSNYATDYPECESVIRSCYSSAKDDFGKMAHLLKEKTETGGSSFASVPEIEAFLSERIVTRKNRLKGRLEYVRVNDAEGKYQYIDETVVNTLWVEMSRTKAVRIADMYHVLESDFSTPYNPLHDYINSLPEWTPDQPDYIEELARTVKVEGGEADQRRFAKYLKKWLVGMVASWMNPEIVNHVVLVFIGKQGVYKSTWFNYLLPASLKAYYCVKTNSSFIDKDDMLMLAQMALACLEEIDAMTDRNANNFKAAITAPYTNIRAAYAHFSEQREHVASFCGTGNNPQFLNEAVSRRWLPFIVTEITSPMDHPFNYTGIYSQVRYLYNIGFRYWFNQMEIQELGTHNEEFQVPAMEDELIAMYFRKPGPEETGQFFPSSLIMKHIADCIGSKLNVVKVGQAMKRLGYESKLVRGTRGWVCMPVIGEELVNMRKRMAMEAVDVNKVETGDNVADNEPDMELTLGM